MKIAVRLDDITPEMDWPKFLRMKELLDGYGLKPLIGVIPENHDETLTGAREGAPSDFWAYIRELCEAGTTVAMHGFTHIYDTKKSGIFPLNAFSEFAGHPYDKQLTRIRTGKKLLRDRGIETDLFMAPAHTFDRNTLLALRDAGFQKVTDGFGKSPYRYEDLTFYPISFRKSDAFRGGDGYTTFVYHTNTMDDKEFESLEKQLAGSSPEAGYEFISYSGYLAAPAAERGFFGKSGEYALAFGKRMLVKLH